MRRAQLRVPFGKAETVASAPWEAFSVELAKPITREQALAALSRPLLQRTVERALQVEMDAPWGYPQPALAGRGSGNRRHGHASKTRKGEIGAGAMQPPRDRQGDFEPPRLGKSQPRRTAVDEQLLTW